MSDKTKLANDQPTDQPTDEWETLPVGLGEEWDFEAYGPLVGTYIGGDAIKVPDKNHPGEERLASYYQFEPDGSPGSIVFLWGSHMLDEAFRDERIRVGAKLRIRYLGKSDIRDGAQTMRRYAVDISRHGFASN